MTHFRLPIRTVDMKTLVTSRITGTQDLLTVARLAITTLVDQPIMAFDFAVCENTPHVAT